MIGTRHAASPTHLPWFITEPGQSDTLMVVTGLFLLLFTVTRGVLMFRLLYLPVNMVPQVQKAKYEIVATLCLLNIFAPGYLPWITALRVAMIDIPDFTSPLQRIADAVGRIAQSKKTKQEILSRPENRGDLRYVNDGTVADQNDLLRDSGGSCDLILSRRHLRIRYDVQSHLASHAWPRMSRRPSSSSDPGLAFYRAVPTHRRAS